MDAYGRSSDVNGGPVDEGLFKELSGDQYAILFSSSQSAIIDIDRALRRNGGGETTPIPLNVTNYRRQYSGGLISDGCRQFIASILRTYPRLMLRSNTLPPFIHPLGCSLYYDSRDPPRAGPRPAVTFRPLKVVETCISIAQTFHLRASTDELLWDAINREHKRIQAKVRFSAVLFLMNISNDKWHLSCRWGSILEANF